HDTFLEELKEATKQSTEAIEILKRILELRRKLDDLRHPAPRPDFMPAARASRTADACTRPSATPTPTRSPTSSPTMATRSAAVLSSATISGPGTTALWSGPSARSIGLIRRLTPPSPADCSWE